MYIPTTTLTQGSFSGARVGMTSDQVLGGSGTLIWDVELWDTSSYHDNVTNNTRLVMPTNGIYRIGFSFRLSAGVSTFASIQTNLETDPTFQAYSSAAGQITYDGGIDKQLNAGDYLTITFGAAATIKAGGAGYPPATFSVERIQQL